MVKGLSLLCLMLLAGMVQAATPLTLGFRPVSVVSHSPVRLGELIHASGVVLPERWPDAAVMALPHPGIGVAVQRDDVERVLRRLGVMAPLAWQGAEAVRVVRKGEVIPADELVEQARLTLARHLGERYRRFELRPVSAPPLMYRGGADARVEARLPARSEAMPRMAVWLDVVEDNAPPRTAPMWFAVAAYAPVYVLTGDVPAGSDLGPETVSIQWRDVAGMGDVLMADRDALDGLRVRSALRAGDLLSQARVDAVPAVRAGDTVQVRARQGAVTVRGRALSRQDGRIGDWVRLLSVGGGESFRGRVVALGEVDVTTGGEGL